MMSKLTEFYSIKAQIFDKRVNDESKWNAYEDELIREELLPELMDLLKPVLSQVKSPLALNISYDPNGNLAINVTRNCIQAMVTLGSTKEEAQQNVEENEPVEEPSTPMVEEENPNDDYEEETELADTQSVISGNAKQITRSKSVGFKVIFPDGTTIHERNAAMTFIATLQKIGLDRIANDNHNVVHLGHKVVSRDKIVSHTKKQTLVYGYYIYTHMSNADKISDIMALSRFYNLNLTVENCKNDEGAKNEETPFVSNENKPNKELTVKEKFHVFLTDGKDIDYDDVYDELKELDDAVRRQINEHIDASADSIYSFTDADDVEISIDILMSSPEFMSENNKMDNRMLKYLQKYQEFVKQL